MSASETLLDVEGLSTSYFTGEGVVRAVRDVSLRIRRGDRVALVGESGSGKSALALSVLGLIEPPGRVVSGRVVLNGRDIAPLRDRELQAIRGREVALIFQDPMTALDPVKTIGAQLVEAIRRHQDVGRAAARRTAAKLLADVEVPQADRRLDDYPHQYSGGMRQRVVIAIAIANNPDVIIADEPTTALDVTTQAQVLTLLDRLASEHHAAILLITHNLGVVAGFCDRVMVMYAGRLVESASTAGLFERRAHPYSDALLRSVPRPDLMTRGPLPAIPGAPPNLGALGPGCAFEPRCALGHRREACRKVAPPVERLADVDGERTSECHYAEEQLGKVKT